MFFILSKVLFFLIQPLNWIVGLLLYSTFTKKAKWKKRSRNSALILLIVFSNGFLFNLIVKAWETDIYPISSLDQNYDIGIVLGGYSNLNLKPRERYHFNPSVNRLTQALELYKEGKVKKLLLTGGTGSLLQSSPKEANEISSFLLKMGVEEDDLILEPSSRNTYENALYTKRILQEDFAGSSCLLITSAFHMRRSKACFSRQNICFTPFSTDIIGEEVRLTIGGLLIPNSRTLGRWEMLIKEWIGYIFYWINGYL